MSMKLAKVRRFLNKDVVGQGKDGLFFEGRIDEIDREGLVVLPGQDQTVMVRACEIRWLVQATRYC